ncbi:hypothetical protein SBA3_2710004 [Candidatus Sulfopaludibacter sp. SbA3]|nr:hypothetical protein SBA3_2710004 [Candidatus Sulfopaludibacter sp. SbA3]
MTFHITSETLRRGAPGPGDFSRAIRHDTDFRFGRSFWQNRDFPRPGHGTQVSGAKGCFRR